MATDEQKGTYEGGLRNYEEMRGPLIEGLAQVEHTLNSPDCTPELAATLAVSLAEVERKLREIRQRADREARRLVRELKRKARIDLTGEAPSNESDLIAAEIAHAKLIDEISNSFTLDEPISRARLLEPFLAKYPDAPKQVRRVANVVWRRLMRRYGTDTLPGRRR